MPVAKTEPPKDRVPLIVLRFAIAAPACSISLQPLGKHNEKKPYLL
jgi:hypothetical protein